MQITTPETRKGRRVTSATTPMQTDDDPIPDRAPLHVTPRHRRLLLALLDGPQAREDVDAIVGASNGPDEVLRARKRFGLTIPCERRAGFDRDRHRVEFGIYSLTTTDRAKVRELLAGAAQ